MSWGWDSLRQRNAYQWYEWYEECWSDAQRWCDLTRVRGAGAPTLWYSQDHGITYLSFSLLITQHLPTHALAAPHYVDIDHRNICCVRIRVSTPESQHPSVIIFSMGSKYLPSPVWCRVIIKNLISWPRRQYFRTARGHVAWHYDEINFNQ